MADELITGDLVQDYEAVAGPVAFTLFLVLGKDNSRVAKMMRDVIDGKRRPITDEELGIIVPDDADI
ncbi:MAG: hypothetical protein ABFS45_06525 [Pseudomonadota bacterium]